MNAWIVDGRAVPPPQLAQQRPPETSTPHPSVDNSPIEEAVEALERPASAPIPNPVVNLARSTTEQTVSSARHAHKSQDKGSKCVLM
uniref:Uncharacterized protein n=1 Tax=Caenorhabditis japonica TaxID=281687 RepID=A0A8R1IND5_CAEJA